MITQTLKLPYNFTPREYELPFLRVMDRGCKRAYLLWHRRAGKDITALNCGIGLSAKAKKAGNYYYYFPTSVEGRKILWEGKTKEGDKFIDYFPPDCVTKVREDDMVIETSWGALWRIIGTDDLRIVGPNPSGLIFSEFALQNPNAWNLSQPILRENDGWAIFPTTPRGHNDAYDLWKTACSDRKEWFAQKLTIDDTYRDAARTQHVIDPAIILHDIESGAITRALAEQEYWCSFEYGQEGSYYGECKATAEREGRIGYYEYDQAHPVYRFADIGSKWTAAIDVQFLGARVRICGEYWDPEGQGANAFAKSMDAMPYTWGKEHFAGHDLTTSNAKSFHSSTTTQNLLLSLGYNFQPVQQMSFFDSIETVRLLWPHLEINSACVTFLLAADGYRAAQNKARSTSSRIVYQDHEIDSWENHMMDALLHLAIKWKYEEIYGVYRGNSTIVQDLLSKKSPEHQEHVITVAQFDPKSFFLTGNGFNRNTLRSQSGYSVTGKGR